METELILFDLVIASAFALLNWNMIIRSGERNIRVVIHGSEVSR